jgi:hypothetical protein
MSPHHRCQHQFGGAFPKQMGGSSRAVDKEYPMLWKIWFIELMFGFLADLQPFALSE